MRLWITGLSGQPKNTTRINDHNYLIIIYLVLYIAFSIAETMNFLKH